MSSAPTEKGDKALFVVEGDKAFLEIAVIPDVAFQIIPMDLESAWILMLLAGKYDEEWLASTETFIQKRSYFLGKLGHSGEKTSPDPRKKLKNKKLIFL
jgi:hypothetical protein